MSKHTPTPKNVNDAIRTTLIAAAHCIEDEGNMHPVRAMALVQAIPWKRAAAWSRLCDVAGMDYMDHTAEENIDDMIAAALWEDA